ncbi:hypothetical protein SRB17_20370 [Streptomyces sp. RB17]|uniref:hypothetical protein n=1 Tax=Streptomyces sp. RB17 TaxID=2585197 RepID=UPI001297446B|nr:hypothetical protein [Streptomyces sp. RB17]MQY34071.1 hypothetical protein [Streptomyces sp. RB17]
MTSLHGLHEARLTHPDPESATPREPILYVFERLERVSADAECHGCPYPAALVELKNPEHPATGVARAVEQRLADTFRAAAERGGARVERLDDGLATATVTALSDAAGMD